MATSPPRLVGLALAVLGCTQLMAAPLISNINPDKSAYLPGSSATIWLDLQNNTGSTYGGTAECSITHLGNVVTNMLPKMIDPLAPNSMTTKSWNWTTPAGDFQGYLISITLRNQVGVVMDTGCSAIDVSSDWVKFPRYGFVARFDSGIDAPNLMWQLKNYHINGVQFYDWQWKHHIPYNNGSSWLNIANVIIQRATVNNLINAVHSYNMVAMSYNTYGSAYDNYLSDGSGVQLSMGIFSGARPAGGYSLAQQLNFSMPNGWATTRIYEMNNRDANWQNYIYGKEQQVFTNLAFDGWHIDALGAHNVYDYEGARFNLDDYNPQFINNAKAALGKRMVFNNVDAAGETQVAQGAEIEFVYSELWNANSNYFDFNRRVDSVRKYTGKAVVFAAYLNRGLSSGNFNEASVRLADAAIFASGGSHIELGDGDRMLHTEYYPDNGSVTMNTSLRAAMRNYYDFLVAYQNLLRDGTVSANIPASIAGVATSTNGQSRTVWLFSKKTVGYTLLHCINFLNNSSTGWRDNNATCLAPPILSNPRVKMYYTGALGEGKLWYATPDFNFGTATELSYTNGCDEVGNFVSFTLPRLQYWDMVCLEMKGSVSARRKTYAAEYDSMAALSTQATLDTGGGLNVAATNNSGDVYLAYNNVDFGAGCASVWARIASGTGSGTLEFHIDSLNGPVIAALAVGNTGGWQSWRTLTAPVSTTFGVHKLFVVFRNAACNLNWFQFSMQPYVQPRVLALPATNGCYSLVISGPIARECTVSASTNLLDWTPVSTIYSPICPLQWTDPAENSSATRFYRVSFIP